MTTNISEELKTTPCLDRGDLGIGVGICRPLSGQKINVEAVKRAIEHVACSDQIVTVQVGYSYITCEVLLPTDDEDEETLELHVLAIVECMLSGIADRLFIDGETLTIPSLTFDASQRDRDLVSSLSD